MTSTSRFAWSFYVGGVAMVSLVLPGCFADKGGGGGSDGASSTTMADGSESNGMDSSEGAEGNSTSEESTGNDDSSTAPEETGETGTTGDPVTYAPCPDGTSAECPTEDPLCVEIDGSGTSGGGGSYYEWHTVCSRECESDADCPTDVMGGTAESSCIEFEGDMICALDCKFGKECPADFECHFDMCVHTHCNCSGDGCGDCPDPEGN